MSRDWPMVPLGELTDNFDGRRIPVKESERKPGPYPYYGASGIVDRIDRYIFDGEYLLIGEDGENLRTRQTPIAFVASGKFWVNNHAHIVRGNHRADTRFLGYVLSQTEISGYLTGSTMPKLTQGNLNRLPVIAPPLAEQKAIAKILGDLDEKIELNRRMNETLEAMACALFQSWFVDFDPVRAKLDGRQPTGMDSATAALFPDSFQDSSLGPIPKGWEVKMLGDVIELAYGKPLKAEDRKNGEYCVYGANGPVGWHDEKLVSGPGIVVGRKGNPGVVTWVPDAFYPIDTTFYVELVAGCTSLYFLYYSLSVLKLANLSADSAVPGLNRNHAYRSKLVIPSPLTMAAFDSQIAPIFAVMNVNDKQSRSLDKMRDTILPKLLSGELTVPQSQSSE